VRPFFHHPRHPYSRGLLGASVSEAGSNAQGGHYTTQRLTEIPGSVASAASEPGCPFAPRCPEVIPACRTAPPALEPVAHGWQVACPVAARTEVRHVAAVD
jgi:peptide/nickel transport system ATP-binding protein